MLAEAELRGQDLGDMQRHRNQRWPQQNGEDWSASTMTLGQSALLGVRIFDELEIIELQMVTGSLTMAEGVFHAQMSKVDAGAFELQSPTCTNLWEPLEKSVENHDASSRMVTFWSQRRVRWRRQFANTSSSAKFSTACTAWSSCTRRGTCTTSTWRNVVTPLDQCLWPWISKWFSKPAAWDSHKTGSWDQQCSWGGRLHAAERWLGVRHFRLQTPQAARNSWWRTKLAIRRDYNNYNCFTTRSTWTDGPFWPQVFRSWTYGDGGGLIFDDEITDYMSFEDIHKKSEAWRRTFATRLNRLRELSRRSLRRVETPSRSPIAKHEAQNHAVYRSWCETCIKARSTGSIHRKRTAEEKVGRQLAATSSYFSQLRFWLWGWCVRGDTEQSHSWTRATVATPRRQSCDSFSRLRSSRGTVLLETIKATGWLRSVFGHNEGVEDEPGIKAPEDLLQQPPFGGMDG